MRCMGRYRSLLVAAGFVLASLFNGSLVARGEDTSVDAADVELNALFRSRVVPLLRTYCYDCHGEQEEVALTQDLEVDDLRRNRSVWIRAISQLRNGTMPPADGPPFET